MKSQTQLAGGAAVPGRPGHGNRSSALTHGVAAIIGHPDVGPVKGDAIGLTAHGKGLAVLGGVIPAQGGDLQGIEGGPRWLLGAGGPGGPRSPRGSGGSLRSLGSLIPGRTLRPGGAGSAGCTLVPFIALRSLRPRRTLNRVDQRHHYHRSFVAVSIKGQQ